MTALVLALLAAAPPPALVVRRDTVDVSAPVVATVLREVVDGLTLAGLAAGQAKPTCNGDAACLAQMAKDAGAIAAVGVTVVKTRKGLSVDLEAVGPDARALGVATFLVPASGEPLPAEGIAFLKRLAPKQEEDAPKKVELTPGPPQRVDEELFAPEPQPSPLRTPMLVATVVTGVASIGLGIAGGVLAGSLQTKLQQPSIPDLTRDQAKAQAGLANGLLTASLISALVAIAAGATTAILFATE